MSRLDKAVREEIRNLVRGTVKENDPMAAHTSFGIGGPAEIWAAPESRENLCALVDMCETEKIPYMIIGRGTNLLVRDAGISGVVISLDAACMELEIDGTRIRAGAAVSLNALTKCAADHGLKGLEFCAGIPGCVAGGLATNAGAWGNCLCEALESAIIYDLRERKIRSVRKDEVTFGYRKSNFSSLGIILEAEFNLAPESPEAINARMKEYRRKRGESQPLGLRSAGCIFKNPPGRKAGAMIDELGFKGHVCGDAIVSDIHANFILNKGSATARDVLAIIDEIKRRVREATGTELEEEIEIVGQD
jgi:UDP-N-acetylmuramate dehydrogenase